MTKCEGCDDGFNEIDVRHEGYCPMCSATIDIIEEIKTEESA